LNKDLLLALRRVVLVAPGAGSGASLGAPRLGNTHGCAGFLQGPSLRHTSLMLCLSGWKHLPQPPAQQLCRASADGLEAQGKVVGAMLGEGCRAHRQKKGFPPPVSPPPGLAALPLTCPGAANKGGITGLKSHTTQKGSIS